MFATGDVANWNSVQFGKVRVTVATVSPSGLVALVAGTFGERWAVVDKLSKVAGRKAATPAETKTRTQITKTATGRKAEMSDGTSVELVSKPRKRTSRRTKGTVEEF